MYHRRTRFEILENREMLSASPAVGAVEALSTDFLGQILSTAGLTPTKNDILNLNSREGATHTICLDFDGHVTTGTLWNSGYNNNLPINTPRFTLDGNTNKTEFTQAELWAIYEIWLRVSEDFLPFNVNITTADPGTEALRKSGGADDAWGIRVCIGGSYADWYGGQAGGLSYLNSFNWDSDSPCFVYSDSLSRNTKFIAECISHEVGHSINLNHSGQGATVYYSGANGWAPIMGASYYEPLTQWSRGDYSGANNTEDQLLIIATTNGFSYRADDYGNTRTTATTLSLFNGTVGTGIIETNTDVDFFAFTFHGDATFRIGGLTEITNLDVLVRVYDSMGQLLLTINPIGTLYVEFTLSDLTGTYYFSVEGTGKSGAYSDYGSLGAYSIVATVRIIEPVITELLVTTWLDGNTNPALLSLREAVILANTRGNGATIITFSSALIGRTITLTAGELKLERGMTIDGSSCFDPTTGQYGIVIDANRQSRAIQIAPSSMGELVTLIGITVTGGNTSLSGGAIYNQGDLLLEQSVITDNYAEDNGGGIASLGLLTIVNSLLDNNDTDNKGGAIYSDAPLIIINSTIADNNARMGGGGIFQLAFTANIINSIVVNNRIAGIGYRLGDDEANQACDIWAPVAIVVGKNSLSHFDQWSNADQSNVRYWVNMPVFVSTNSRNYQLISGSVAINSGNSLLADEYGVGDNDLLHSERFIGTSIDMGAFEFYTPPKLVVEKSEWLSGAMIRIEVDIFSPLDTAYAQWEINWGDGTTQQLSQVTNFVSLYHYFVEDGGYSISLQIMNLQGIWSPLYQLAFHFTGAADDLDGSNVLLPMESSIVPTDTAPIDRFFETSDEQIFSTLFSTIDEPILTTTAGTSCLFNMKQQTEWRDVSPVMRIWASYYRFVKSVRSHYNPHSVGVPSLFRLLFVTSNHQISDVSFKAF